MSNFQSRKGGSGKESVGAQGRLGEWRGPAGQTDRDDIDVFQEAAVRRQHLTAHARARERAFDLDIGIDARGQVVVPRHEHAVGFQTQIELRFGQFRQIDRAAEGKRAAGEIPAEAVKSQPVLPEIEQRLKIRQGGQGRVLESRQVDVRISRAAQIGLGDRAAYFDVERDRAVELVERGDKLPDEIDRAARHLDSGVDRRLLVQLLLRDQLGKIERQLRVYLHRLDARLLNFSSHFEFVILEAQPEINRRRLQLFDGIRAQA